MNASDTTFLDSLIRGIVDKDPEAASRTCFIFPTRRACLIFRNKLAAAKGGPVWSPGVLSIRDFVEIHSGVRIADEKELLLLLYGVNRKYWPGQSFTRFHSWGQMLLNDFDEVDKQLDSPDELFTGIRQIKQLEQHFAADEEALEWIKNFTGVFDPEHLTELQQKFAGNWDQLLHIYTEFRAILTKKGAGYEGLAYRSLLSRIRSGTFTSKWAAFEFAGFYGLSSVEELLISELSQRFSVSLKWDTDKYYISEVEGHEAGRYFRQLKKKQEIPAPDHFTGRSIEISVTGVPMRSGQAKYAGHLLNEMLKNGTLDPDKTAIVLPDESQLFPVLYSLPAGIHPVNVTMGLPLRHTVYADLANTCMDLFCSARKNSTGQIVYYHSHLEALQKNPLLARFRQNTEQTPDGFKSWLKAEDITIEFGAQLTLLLSSPPGSAPAAALFMAGLFRDINKQYTLGKNTFDTEVCRFLETELTELSELLNQYESNITAEDGWHIIAEVVSLLKLPFSGEPVKGLQVMGFLETRALDFENVIILGCNEDILPKNSQSKSFIPYSLRRAFGLSTYMEQDASSAYHFYRLFHKAKKVFLVYDTEIRGLTGSEASRFILQLEHEFRNHKGFDVRWNRQIVHTPVKINLADPQKVKKSAEVLESLSRFTRSDKKGRFSSTSLTTYISCSLRFYYTYVAGIREQREEADTIEADVFGNILHDALEKLYTPLTGKQILPADIEPLIQSTPEAVEAAIRNIFGAGAGQLEGNDRILADALKELVKRILQADKKTAPFELLGLESDFETAAETRFGTVLFYGRFDRVDRHRGSIRIIDYKTGKVKTTLKKDLEKVFTNPDYKTLFQLFFYAYVYRNNHPQEHIIPGFYVAQTLSEGLTMADVVNAENAEWFGQMLTRLVEEILDPDIDFEPTSELKRCKHCPFKDLCNR